MPESEHPTLDELMIVLSHTADRVRADREPTLDPIVRLSLGRAIVELKRYVPGLHASPDIGAASAFESESRSALHDRKPRKGLYRALLGLSLAPHDPGLWHLVATACLEMREDDLTVLLLQHSLWINPGQESVRNDLHAMCASTDIAAMVYPGCVDPGIGRVDHETQTELRLDERDEERDSGDDNDEDT